MPYYIGIDFGDLRIGLAISDQENKIAFPLGVIVRENNSYGFNKLKRIIENKPIEAFVVGLPVKSNGNLGQQGEKVLIYMESLKSHFSYKVISWDERFTTVIAERTLIEGNVKREKRKKVRDEIAAQLILQSYLDHINKM